MVKNMKLVWGVICLIGVYLLFFTPGTGITGPKIVGIVLAVIALIFLSLPKTDNRYEQQLVMAWHEFVNSPDGTAFGVQEWASYMKPDDIYSEGDKIVHGIEAKPYKQFWLVKVPTRTRDSDVFLLRRFLKPNANQVRFCGHIPPERAKGMTDNDLDDWANGVSKSEDDQAKNIELGILRRMAGGGRNKRRLLSRSRNTGFGEGYGSVAE